jgi:hypothetical protein
MGEMVEDTTVAFAQTDTRLADFDALLQIARDGDWPVGTSDVYGNFRSPYGGEDFPKVTGRGRVFKHEVQVPDFLAPRLTVPAKFMYSVMAVQESGSDTTSKLAFKSQIQWLASTGVSEAVRVNYIMRPADWMIPGYALNVYWWQLSQRHVGQTFQERLADGHRRVYFTLVVDDLVASGNPMFAMLSARPSPEVQSDFLPVMREQIERELRK